MGFILTGYGSFAGRVASAVEMISGPQKEFLPVSFKGEEAGEFPDKLHRAIEDMLKRDHAVVVFCDLLGGTPFNQALICSAMMPGVEVIAGTNLPMLLECLTSRSEDTVIEQVISCAIGAGREGIEHRVLSTKV